MPMDAISPTNRPPALPPSAPPRHGRLANRPAPQAAPAARDEATISRIAHLLNRLRAMPDVRHERIERVQREIATGTYETPARLESAVAALLDELR